MKNIAIIGSGSWGVALAVYLANQGKKVKIWSFAKEEADLINNEKKCKFLPNITLPEGIECTLSYEEAIKNSEIILHVTPSKFTRSIVKEYKKFVTNQPIIICSKGFEKDSLKTLKIKVTDPELIALTGGIIQGLSGSPILQNGKLVGAVTHVLIDNPKMGYGIFAESMIK